MALMSSCSRDVSVQDYLVKRWSYRIITNEKGGAAIPSAPTDTFRLYFENVAGSKVRAQKFSYQLKEAGKSESGTWALSSDSVLTLTYDLKPGTAVLDSAVYRVEENGSPVFDWYREGKKIATSTEQGVTRTSRNFKISFCDAKRLVMSESATGLKFELGYESQLNEAAFSFQSMFRGILGVLFLVGILYLFSSDRKNIPWRIVGAGLALQILFAFGVLKVPFVQSGFEAVSNFFLVVLQFTREGSQFVFGGLLDVNTTGFIFAFQILPTVLFFSALTSLLFYLGVLQKIVYVFAWLMSKFMKLSGAESLAAAANIFLGQTEAPLMVKPYIGNMTRSELLCVMSGGMATIAGGVLAAYIGFLGGDDPVRQLFYAKHLLAASVMSAPAAIIAAKMLLPEREEVDTKLEISKEKIGGNILEAISNGTLEGLKLAANVGAMLLVFIALMAMVNYLIGDVFGEWTGLNAKMAEWSGGIYNKFSLDSILGYICAPIAYALGVCQEDALVVGQLLGQKTVLNEFVAYATLGDLQAQHAFKEEKSIILSTYILCGFANFASIGIQIGGIGTLAPNKRRTLSELGIKALIGGTAASLFTAAVVGMFL